METDNKKSYTCVVCGKTLANDAYGSTSQGLKERHGKALCASCIHKVRNDSLVWCPHCQAYETPIILDGNGNRC